MNLGLDPKERAAMYAKNGGKGLLGLSGIMGLLAYLSWKKSRRSRTANGLALSPCLTSRKLIYF